MKEVEVYKLKLKESEDMLKSKHAVIYDKLS